MYYSLWYNAPTMLPAGGRQHRGCIIPQAVTHSLVLLKMGVIDHRPKHVELIRIINKTLLLHLVDVKIIYVTGCYSAYSFLDVLSEYIACTVIELQVYANDYRGDDILTLFDYCKWTDRKRNT